MDSSPVLRQQCQNTVLNDHSSLNRMTADTKPGSKHPSVPRPSKHLSVPHPSKPGPENKDPAAASDDGPKLTIRPLGISRLPVLAKSLPLKTPSDFTRSHKRWEDNSLAGKAKRMKPSTKPVPFNFSNLKANRKGVQNQRGPLAATARAGAQPTQPKSTFSNAAHLKTRPTITTTQLPSSIPANHNKAQSKSTIALAAHLKTRPTTTTAQLPSSIPATHNKAQSKSTIALAAQLKTRPTTTTAQLPSSIPATHNKAQSKSTIALAAQLPTIALHLAARKAGSGPGGILSQQNRELGKPHQTQAPSAATSMSLSQHPKQSSSETLLHVPGLGQLSRPPSSFALGSGLSSSAFSFSSASTASAQPTALSTEACGGHFDMLSMKDPSMPGQLPSSSTGSVEAAFHSDPSALCSILQNEGIGAARVFMSSRPSTQAYNNMPQRVSIMKNGLRTVPSAGPVRNVKLSPALGNILQTEGVGSPLELERVSVMKSHQTTAASAGPVRSVQFSPEPSSLNSILQDEGVSYSLQPQRVSVMKSHKKSAASAGPVRRVQFFPDAAALGSILQKEEVKAGTPLEATPQRTSVCPSGRGTSIYTAQRVPITKWHTEAPGEPMVTSISLTPALKWTPQRVPDTRHQPMSMEVVQTLFKETEEEEQTDCVVLDQDPAETRADQQLAKEEKQSNTGGRLQTFFQAAHRESVIFFSTGKKLHRPAPAHEQESPVAGFLERGGPMEHCAAGGQEAMHLLPLHPKLDRASAPEIPEVTAAATDLTRLTNLSAFVPLRQPRGSIMFPKSGALSSATALLRRRLPPLKELRLDEEVATYTSSSSPALPPSSSWPLQTRCGNPVAAALHLQDYTFFRPIILDPSSTSSSSPLRER
ncbi:endochitinase A isoform X2 [Oncorhynchus mykiss]|uniref:endochitinase A isoform X2 n=1 Tax=Oncorhynchus mykiss TaxID=8022 RepID=UPI0018789C09|nr:endochitinase A isoform X2 [Oncorhynchus mykiss]